MISSAKNIHANITTSRQNLEKVATLGYFGSAGTVTQQKSRQGLLWPCRRWHDWAMCSEAEDISFPIKLKLHKT